MSSTVIHSIKKHLNSIFSNSEEIKKSVKHICFSIKQDLIFPIIFIEIKEISDLSRYNQNKYKLIFDINIYTKDKTNKESLDIAEIIEKEVERLNEFEKYFIASIKKISIKFDLASDLNSNKTTLSYSALILEKRIL